MVIISNPIQSFSVGVRSNATAVRRRGFRPSTFNKLGANAIITKGGVME